MEYNHKDRLRQLILDTPSYSNPEGIHQLNIYLSQSIQDLQDKYDYWSSTQCYPKIGQGPESIARHLTEFKNIHDEAIDLVDVLPGLISELLTNQDLAVIWPELPQNNLNRTSNPLETRFQDILQAKNNYNAYYQQLRDIFDLTQKLELGRETILLLSVKETDDQGLGAYLQAWTILKRMLPASLNNHPAVLWALGEGGSSQSALGFLPAVQTKRNAVKNAIQMIADAYYLDLDFGKSLPDSVLPQSKSSFDAYIQYLSNHPTASLIEWAWSILETLSSPTSQDAAADSRNETGWKEQIHFSDRLIGERNVRQYLENEKDLIIELRKALQKCETNVNQVYNSIDLYELLKVGPTLLDQTENISRAFEKITLGAFSGTYEKEMHWAGYANALILLRIWLLGEKFDPQAKEEEIKKLETDKAFFNRIIQESIKLLSGLNTWESLSIFLYTESEAMQSGQWNLKDPDALFGWENALSGSQRVRRGGRMVEIPKPEMGNPGSSRWRRESFEGLSLYQIAGLFRIRCAIERLTQLGRVKNDWDRACIEVEEAARKWEEAISTSAIVRRIKNIRPEVYYDLLSENICTCCRIAPDYDHYRVLYGTNCKPGEGSCRRSSQ